MNKQRESVYTLRREILEGKIHLSEEEVTDMRGYVMATAEELLDDKIDLFAGKDVDADDWDLPGAAARADAAVRARRRRLRARSDRRAERRRAARRALGSGRWRSTRTRKSIVPRDILTRVERDLMLQIVDQQWKDHLYSLDHLKEGIGLRGYGQRDPLVEYKKESFALFQDMRAPHRGRDRPLPVVAAAGGRARGGEATLAVPGAAGAEAAGRAQLQQPGGAAAVGLRAEAAAPPAAAPARRPHAGSPRRARVGGDDAPIKTVKRDEPKIGRNDPCWCGSGKKFKKCHGA